MSTVAAISTPNASGGIGVIRISGEEAIAVADKVFVSISGKKLEEHKGYTAAYGSAADGDIKIDECVALVFRAPKSYTGEDVVELSCHGGLYVTKRVLRAVLAAGAEPAPPGEFTKRAYLNGKIDLAEAESVMNIISANGQTALNAALNTLDGKVSRRINDIIAKLTHTAAAIAYWTDSPDEDVPEAENDSITAVLNEAVEGLGKLIRDFDNGKVITSGIKTVIAGHPNVGKSTLMNLLAGYDKSIVTSVAGTTRDVVEETVTLGDIILDLADTAGIRESDDVVEAIGIEKAIEKLERAQLVLAVFDNSIALTDEDMMLLEKCRDKLTVAVINKSDLDKKLDKSVINEYIPNVVRISAKEGSGTDELKTMLENVLGTSDIDSSAGMLASERQRKCCEDALTALKDCLGEMEMGITLDAVNVNIDYAVDKLLELTGEKVRDVVVSEIFSKFCVGK